MNIATGTIQTLTLNMTEPEARAFLADPGPTQDAVRSALAAFHKGAGTANTRAAVESKPRGKRGRAAGSAKPKAFLVEGAHKCINCGRAFNTKPALNIHRARAHDSKGAADALSADGVSIE